jgi:hypothetical protein
MKSLRICLKSESSPDLFRLEKIHKKIRKQFVEQWIHHKTLILQF